MFNVESSQELQAINEVAGRIGKKAPISIRVNPDIDAKTHPYISTGLKQNKFGIDILRAPLAYRMATQLPNLKVLGLTATWVHRLLRLNLLWKVCGS